MNFQKDLYEGVKGNTTTKSTRVASFAMAHPEDTINFSPLLYMDYECMHSYPGGALPDNDLTNYWIPLTNNFVGEGNPPKPIIATETGYHTSNSLPISFLHVF